MCDGLQSSSKLHYTKHPKPLKPLKSLQPLRPPELINPSSIPDGPILVHTTFGDLLRSLDSPAALTAPLNLALSREGFVVAHFPGGHVASFTANGNLLRHELHNDKIQGRTTIHR